jgi:hypothetical protein
VARIRSIKPDFFTSETIASLPLSARLTFIGLWTYVDDNGVGLYNEMLINAAVWPLEEDSLETLARTREDLASLSRIGLVRVYRDSRKRYLFVTSWDEHQKVDHPRKPRYPRPDTEGCGPVIEPVPACENTETREDLANDSREPREDLAPEQGAGSRDQGREKPLGRQAGRSPEPGSDADPDFAAFWDAYPRKTAKTPARKAWRTAVRSRKSDPKDIIRGAERYRDDPRRNPSDLSFTAHPATWLNAERWLDYSASTASQPRRNRGFWED